MKPISINGQIAAVAPVSVAIKVTGKDKGFAVAEQKTMLLQMQVLYDADGGVQAGETIYLPGESTGAEWMKRRYSVDNGPEFVMVPFTSVLLVKGKDATNNAALTEG